MSDESIGSSRAPTWVWIALAVLVAALVFTTTLAVIQWRRAGDLRHNESLRRSAAATAAQFGQALYTYDFNDLATAKARVLRLTTARYAKGYETNSAKQQQTIAGLKAKETAKPAGVFLTDVVKDRVAGIVILDTSLQSTAGNRSSVAYLDLALVRQGSTWKVDTAKPVTTVP
jgi:Mce-associated membrane protein